MPYQPHSFTIADAIARNNDLYEVEFTRWGTRLQAPGVQNPEENLQYPPPNQRPIPSSISVAAIGPRSTVDRCWMSWDRQKRLDIPPGDVVQPDPVVSLPRIITCDAPLLFPQAARAVPSLDPATQSWWEAMQLGLAYVFPWGPKPGVNSQGQGDGTKHHGGAFGTTTGFYVGQTLVTLAGDEIPFAPTEEPFLHLLLYTKPPLFAPSGRRAAMLRTKVWSMTDAADTDIIAIYPIFGRKRVGLSLISHSFSGVPGKTCDYTIGIIRNVNEDPFFEPAPLFEVKAAELLGVPANTGVNIQLNNQCADYLVVHVNTLNPPAGGALTMVAED